MPYAVGFCIVAADFDLILYAHYPTRIHCGNIAKERIILFYVLFPCVGSYEIRAQNIVELNIGRPRKIPLGIALLGDLFAQRISRGIVRAVVECQHLKDVIPAQLAQQLLDLIIECDGSRVGDPMILLGLPVVFGDEGLEHDVGTGGDDVLQDGKAAVRNELFLRICRL